MLRPVVLAVLIVVGIALSACEDSKLPTQPTTPVSGSPVSINGSIREKLSDGSSGLPVAGARVEVVADLAVIASTASDEAGRYGIVAVKGSFDLKISKDGYEPNTLRVGPMTENLMIDAAIAPILRTLVGIVTETPPTETTPIAGAKVEIVSGSNRGKVVTTDGNGYYSIAGVWGDFDVSVSSRGFDATTAHASVNETVKRLDVKLMPDEQPIHTVFTGDLCTVAHDRYATVCAGNVFPYPVQTHHRFPVHRPGIMTVDVNYRYEGDYYQNYLNFEIRCGGELVAEKRVCKAWDDSRITLPDKVTGPVQVALPRACEVDVRLFDYLADRKGGDWTTYRVDIRHAK